MNTQSNKVGLDALLTPENSLVILIDHQPFQFANLRSMEPTMVINNTIGLAKGAKAFKVPTILTTVVKDRGGNLPEALQAWERRWVDAEQYFCETSALLRQQLELMRPPSTDHIAIEREIFGAFHVTELK